MNATFDALSLPMTRSLTPRARRILARACLVLLISLPCIALATPPSWAPAHGWRKKNDPGYAGYSGRQWERDYGVRSGRCDRSEIGAVLGGIAGGVIGAEVAKGEDRGAAIVLGTVIGAAIGYEIGRSMDVTDRSCVGHALELTQPGQTVSWTNPNTRVSYKLTPTEAAERADGCRKFRLIATGGFGLSEGRTIACPRGDGTWDVGADARLGQR